ncbi:MAG: leucine-rich repeat domain-containing protein, partial [Prevotella sp.]|nr:leucine-rich repeat domain-containing protein [Prevotella sp.]
FPASLQEIGWAAFKRTNITEADLAVCTNMTRIRFETFEECHNLTTATFPVNLIEIQKEAFAEADLSDVDLSECHNLRMLAGHCFNENSNLINVTLCSHAKTIRGNNEYTTDDSEGAFHLCNAIKKVEVVGCEGTCVTECVCENRAFEWDITHYQTAAPSTIMENVALLIFPEDLPVCDQSPYSSSWDFFVGDYKNGVMITQENLLAYYRHVPNTGTSDHAKVNEYDENGNKIGEHFDHVECMYQIGNGWHEFIRVGRGEIIKVGEFLRTYSRTEGDGPCQLPTELTAYRAVDFYPDKFGWVLDKKNGTYICTDETKAESDRTDDDYVLIADLEGMTNDEITQQYPNFFAEPYTTIANRPLYSHLTIGGKLYLRPLIAKLAQYPGISGGYTDDNKEQFDSEEVYSQLTAVPGGHSYVPERTGVVIYSTRINEEAFLMLPGDFGTDVVYKEFPHTGDRYEEARRLGGEGVNTDDDINMLHGSFGTGWPVAPVFPWKYKNAENCTGGLYQNPKEYRNFACVKTGTVSNTGTTLEKNTYGWKRLQPSKMKVNRAFAQIPINRFDNFNETIDQYPDFTIEDEPVENPSSNLMLISIFEDETENAGSEIDGIKTIDTVVVKADSDAWYTIQGVRVAQPTKGVYIHNGQKVVIK